jgi:hypothetical protein
MTESNRVRILHFPECPLVELLPGRSGAGRHYVSCGTTRVHLQSPLHFHTCVPDRGRMPAAVMDHHLEARARRKV